MPSEREIQKDSAQAPLHTLRFGDFDGVTRLAWFCETHLLSGPMNYCIACSPYKYSQPILPVLANTEGRSLVCKLHAVQEFMVPPSSFLELNGASYRRRS